MYRVALAGYIEFNKTSWKGSLSPGQKLLFVKEADRFAQYGAFPFSNSAMLPYAQLKDVFKQGGGLDFETYTIKLWQCLDHTGCPCYLNFFLGLTIGCLNLAKWRRNLRPAVHFLTLVVEQAAVKLNYQSCIHRQNFLDTMLLKRILIWPAKMQARQ